MPEDTCEIRVLLQQGMADVEALFASLKAEYGALENSDLDGFEKAVVDKQTYSTNLHNIEGIIFEKITNSGFAPTREGFEQYLATQTTCQNDQTLYSLWQRLQLTVISCHKQNQINGRIVKIANLSVQQTLNFLTGQDLSTGLYDPSGKSDEDPPNSALAIV